jgi:hypothetical protein
LRAKLGAEHEALIGTVRNVGYRFVPVKGDVANRGGDEIEARADMALDEETRAGAATDREAHPAHAKV